MLERKKPCPDILQEELPPVFDGVEPCKRCTYFGQGTDIKNLSFKNFCKLIFDTSDPG